MASNLMAHSDKFNSKQIGYAELAALPVPMVLGTKHQPVPHVQLVDTILAEMDRRDLRPTKQQYALGAKGAALFGVIDLAPKQESLAAIDPTSGGLSFGFRAANDMSLAIKAVAGTRVFVCDNLALSGDMIALSRKHTTGLDLADEIRRGFDKFLHQAEVLATQVAAMTNFQLTDEQAKVIVFDAFAAKFLPVRLLDDVAGFYFQASDETPDCQPRSLWGLHNAFTRAMKTMKPVPAFEATVQLGRHFGLQSAGTLVVQ